MDPFSVILISYFKLHRLRACVDSMLGQMRPCDELVIIDNSVSTAGEVDLELREYLGDVFNRNFDDDSPAISIYLNKWNHFFTSSVNEGIRKSSNEYIFLVNNDTEVVTPNTFKTLINFAKTDPTIATVTPVTLQSNDSVYCSGAYGGGAHKKDKIKEPREAEWSNFAFVLIKRKVIEKIGPMALGRKKVGTREVELTHYHSDEEFCRRATGHGFTHWVHPLIVRHYHKEDETWQHGNTG